MLQLTYITGNDLKFHRADTVCRPLGIKLTQGKLDIQEIQAETGEPVALDKAAKAFALLGKPVVVSDDSWMIPGLNNFPGPYMKSMNDWLTPDDWLRLTSTLTDRRIILRSIVVYQDANIQKLFVVDIHGVLLREARGKSPYAHAYVTSFDNGKTSNAEYHAAGKSAPTDGPSPWHKFAEWYIKHSASTGTIPA